MGQGLFTLWTQTATPEPIKDVHEKLLDEEEAARKALLDLDKTVDKETAIIIGDLEDTEGAPDML